MHLYFPDLVEDSFQWASNVPKETDVYITTDTVEKKEAILKVFKNLPCNHLEVRVIVNRGRDVSSILVGVKDVIQNYDYACFVHDKKTAQAKPGSVGDSLATNVGIIHYIIKSLYAMYCRLLRIMSVWEFYLHQNQIMVRFIRH